MHRGRRLAAAQTIPIRGDVEANLEQHLRLARIAVEADAQIAVFPELSLTGYELGLADELAFAERDARLAPLRDAAASHSLILVAGAPVRLESGLHIGAFVLFPDGAVEIYTKHHLGAFSASAAVDGVVPAPESSVFARGARNPLVPLVASRAAIAVCADTGRPAHSRQAAERGASTYLASAFVIPSEFDREVANLANCAVRHAMVVVLANFGGPSGGLAAAGRSAIWSDAGKLLVQLEAGGAGVALASEGTAGWRTQAIPLDGP